MSLPRRRMVRSLPDAGLPVQQRQRRAQTLRARLDQERTALRRWMSRLKRAFHSVERIEQRITRIDRQLSNVEES